MVHCVCTQHIFNTHLQYMYLSLSRDLNTSKVFGMLVPFFLLFSTFQPFFTCLFQREFSLFGEF